MLGVFGGTFDPVHYGHLKTVEHVHRELNLTSTLLIPLGMAVHRQQPDATASQRYQMLSAAVAGVPGLIADDREIQRPGNSFTVDTIKSVAHEYPGQSICLVIGSDAFNGFHQWHQPDTILELAHLVVMHRPGMPVVSSADNHYLKKYQCGSIEHLQENHAGHIYLMPVPQLEISSSLIRERLQQQRPVKDLVPEAVEHLIKQWGLYLKPL